MNDSRAFGQLGHRTAYVDRYDPTLLLPIARATQRASLGLQDSLPFLGADLWTAYELSWLNLKGKPQVALLDIVVPCESPCLIESKSLKLYLNSFHNTPFDAASTVRARIQADLSQAAQASVDVRLITAENFDQQIMQELSGLSLDRLDLECQHYQPAPELLSADKTQAPVEETLVSQLLKSNCLVTDQPDWGSVQIAYSGAPIDHAGLLRYIVSFRNHQEFHEHCVERMFCDIWRQCQPTRLCVYARYTRRGGLDINPLRASYPMRLPTSVRTARQ